MEAEQNANASQLPPKEEIRQTSPVEEKSKDLWVILLNIFLALLTILLLAYVAYKNGYINLDNIFNTKDNGEEQAQNEDSTTGEEKIAVVDEEELTLETYEGTVLSAILPSKWSIKEYTNGDGTDMLVDGVTYTGLTGLKVFNGNKEIMYVKAVSGIGFVGCSELPLFTDSSAGYLQEQKDMNAEVQMDMTTIDYTGTDFTDFEWFGKDFRRVLTFLYFDTVTGNEYFEPQCEKGLVTVPGFTFEDSDGYEGTAYFYGINELATNAELEALDGILASMVAN